MNERILLRLNRTTTDISHIFPRWPGCHTWGETYEFAVRNAEEALALYLETLAENGDSIPGETSRDPITLAVTVRTPVIE